MKENTYTGGCVGCLVGLILYGMVATFVVHHLIPCGWHWFVFGQVC